VSKDGNYDFDFEEVIEETISKSLDGSETN